MHVSFPGRQGSLLWVDINITVRSRQREHREACYSSWPKLTRDIIGEREKLGRELHYGEYIPLMSADLTFYTSLSCSHGVKTAYFLIKAVYRVINYGM